MQKPPTKPATLQLIELAERLNMTGVIGDGTVARFHELATLSRIEQGYASALGPTAPGQPNYARLGLGSLAEAEGRN